MNLETRPSGSRPKADSNKSKTPIANRDERAPSSFVCDKGAMTRRRFLGGSLAYAGIAGALAPTVLNGAATADKRQTLSGLVAVLLALGETRAKGETGVTRLRRTLQDIGLDGGTSVGPLENGGESGFQVITAKEGGGFLNVRLYYDDFIEPLIIRKGTTTLSRIAPQATSCCMTEVDCGAGLKCLTAEDPCPTDKKLTDFLFTYPREPHLRRLFEPERLLSSALSDLVWNLYSNRKPAGRSDVTSKVRSLRDEHTHRELQFAFEEDKNGTWLDWILKLSNGSVLAFTLANGPNLKPFIVPAGTNMQASLQTGTMGFSFVPTDLGDLVGVPRTFLSSK